MSDFFNIEAFSSPVSKWKMLWVRIAGKRKSFINLGFEVVGYTYKDCFYVTTIRKLK